RCCTVAAFLASISRWVGGLCMNSPGGLHANDVRPGEHTSPVTYMKILDIPQSGKWGNSVSVRTRYGQSRRPLVIPKDPKTPAQLRSRSTLGHVAPRWRGLSDEQRTVLDRGWPKAPQPAPTRPVGSPDRLPVLHYAQLQSRLH